MDEQTGQTGDETLSEILDAVTGGFTSVSDIERQGYDTLASRLESIGSAVSEILLMMNRMLIMLPMALRK